MHPILLTALAISAVAALIDWRTRTIPNWLTLGTLALAPWVMAYLVSRQAGGWSPESWRVVRASYIGALACGFAPLVLALRGYAGMGDAKLFAALGAMLGARIGIEAEFYSICFAALYGPARLAYEGRLFKTMRTAIVVAVHPRAAVAQRHEMLDHMMTRFALAPAVFVGTALATWLHWRAV